MGEMDFPSALFRKQNRKADGAHFSPKAFETIN